MELAQKAAQLLGHARLDLLRLGEEHGPAQGHARQEPVERAFRLEVLKTGDGQTEVGSDQLQHASLALKGRARPGCGLRGAQHPAILNDEHIVD